MNPESDDRKHSDSWLIWGQAQHSHPTGRLELFWLDERHDDSRGEGRRTIARSRRAQLGRAAGGPAAKRGRRTRLAQGGERWSWRSLRHSVVGGVRSSPDRMLCGVRGRRPAKLNKGRAKGGRHAPAGPLCARAIYGSDLCASSHCECAMHGSQIRALVRLHIGAFLQPKKPPPSRPRSVTLARNST